MVTTEERVSKLEGAYEQVDQRLGELHVEVREIRAEMTDRLDRILIAILAGAAGVIFTLIAGIIAVLIRI